MERDEEFTEYEIDLKEYIQVLWNGKWIIIGLVILGGLAAGIFSKVIMKPQYEANANLLILPPTYKTSLEVSSLPIETYRNLALTDSMKQRIIDEVDYRYEDGEAYVPSDLDGKLNVEVLSREQERDGETIEMPLFVLKVQGTDPKRISKAANVWADSFMEVSKEIRISEVKEVSQVIQEQFEATEKKLTGAKEELRSFKEEARLDLAESELKIKKKRLNSYKDKIGDLNTKLGSKKAEYEQLKKNISEAEKDGEWLGDLANENTGSSESSLTRAKENYLNAQNKLLKFQKNNDIELLKQEIKVEENKLEEYQNRILSLQTTLDDKQIEIDKLEALLAKEPARWDLKKTLTEDALWQNILNPEEIEVLKNMQLSNEIINPVYRKLRMQLTEDRLLVNKIPEQIKSYEDLVAKKTDKIKEMKTTLDQWQQRKNRLETDLANYRSIYQKESDTYQNLKSRLLQIGTKIDSLQAQLNFYEEKQVSLEEEVKELQDRIWEDQITKEKLTQQVSDIQKTYNMLAQKVEEARISESQKTSDVKFIADAIPPTKPIGPNVKLNIAIAGVLGLMLGVFVVFFREFLNEEDILESKTEKA